VIKYVNKLFNNQLYN